jgi:hypothetical protein
VSDDWEPCGRGVCAAEEGHEGTCPEASGWADHDLRMARKFPGECTEGVTRKGEFQPCDKPAVAVRMDPEYGSPYPVCAYHARGAMVPLAVLLADRLPQDARP